MDLHRGRARPRPRDLAAWLEQAGPSLAVIAVGLALGSLLVAALEGPGGVPNGSAAYLLVVVGVAYLRGTRAAILAAIGAFLAYDFLLIEPRFTLTVSDP